MKPLIGVVADVHAGAKHVVHSVQQKYLDAVTGGAGAMAVILPASIATPGGAWSDPAEFSDILGRLDGLFLTGAISNVPPSATAPPSPTPHPPPTRRATT